MFLQCNWSITNGYNLRFEYFSIIFCILDQNFPHHHVGGGDPIGIVSSLDACRTRCINAALTVCGAFDFTVNRRCYLHGQSTSCNQPQSFQNVLHVKVVSCTVPFPVPVPVPVPIQPPPISGSLKLVRHYCKTDIQEAL